VCDLSDHFINFTEIVSPFNKNKTNETVPKRQFSKENIDRFRLALQPLRWESVLNKTTVDEALEEFSSIFSDLYELNFPLTHYKFNKNIHKINKFMTAGLLISRQNKIKLQKTAAMTRNNDDILKFKQYRNVFNGLIRASKKHYFEHNLHTNKKNPKKTWELLKEATNLLKNLLENETVSCMDARMPVSYMVEYA
jgi:hypothetical protein